eukprot:s6673_g2.t1
MFDSRSRILVPVITLLYLEDVDSDAKDKEYSCDVTTNTAMFFQMTMSVTLCVFIYEGTSYNLIFLGRVLPALGEASLVPFFFLLFNIVWVLALCAYLRAFLADPGRVPTSWHEFVLEVGSALPVVPSTARWTPGKASRRNLGVGTRDVSSCISGNTLL